MSTKRLQRQKGFTLIELLIVFVIMSLLTGLGIGAFMTSRQRARDAKRKGDLENIARAVELYYADYGQYPLSIVGNEGFKPKDNPEVTWGGTFENDGTLYMAELPKDPGAYTYHYQSWGTSYRIFARLENVEDAAVPLFSGDPGAYNYDCDPGIGTTTPKCNYVIRSTNDTVALTPVEDN